MSHQFARFVPVCRAMCRPSFVSKAGRMCPHSPMQHLKRGFYGSKWDPMSDMRAVARDMEREMERFERKFDYFGRNFPFSFPFPRFARHIPVQTSTAPSANMFRINVDLAGFKPKDVTVTVKDRVLTIQAKKEQVAEDGGKVYQEICREYTIPEEVDINSFKSQLTDEGILSIEAALPEPAATGEPTDIPINFGEGDATSKSQTGNKN